jgi:hypothetical protein
MAVNRCLRHGQSAGELRDADRLGRGRKVFEQAQRKIDDGLRGRADVAIRQISVTWAPLPHVPSNGTSFHEASKRGAAGQLLPLRAVPGSTSVESCA